MDFRSIIKAEAGNRLGDDSQSVLFMMDAVLMMDSEMIGACFNPVKSKHTINGYRRYYDGPGSTKITNEMLEELKGFIEKNYKGKRPLANLHRAVNRRLAAKD